MITKTAFVRKYGLIAVILAFVVIFARPAFSQTANPNDPLILGNRNASVQIIEYVSLTCGHCANFHRDVFPTIKEKYIDTNLISFEIRDFPLDGIALQASVLARCIPGIAVRGRFIELLLETQDIWISGDGTMVNLNNYARDAGLSEEQITACSENLAIRRMVVEQRKQGSTRHKVRGTPTLILNDKAVDGGVSLETLSRAIEEALP